MWLTKIGFIFTLSFNLLFGNVTGADSTYNISLSLTGSGMTQSDRDIFQNASSRWMEVVTGDVVDIASSGMYLFLPNCVLPAVIDDLHICGEISDIEGPSGVIGQAGITYFRTKTSIPILGWMQYEPDYIQSLRESERLYPHILHEIGHMLGIGFIWSLKGVISDKSTVCQYIGKHGNKEYRSISGCKKKNLPIQTGGKKCFSTHFDESCFKDELMSRDLNNALLFPLSRLTIATLQDLGYTVDYTKADGYSSADMAKRCVCKKQRNLRIVRPIDLATNNNKSSNNKSKNKRKLSDEGLRSAIQHGKKVLLKVRKQYNSMPSSFNNNDKFVGSDLISVIYNDGDNGVFSVIVTPFS